MELKTGDVILCPAKNTNGIYTAMNSWLVNTFKDNIIIKVVGKAILDYLTNNVFKHKYIHAEIYLGNGWQMGAWFNGVHLWKPPLQYFSAVHIYRTKKPLDSAKILKKAKKEFNKNYDFTSLILNSAIEILSLGNEEREQALESAIKQLYDNSNSVICSELVARILKASNVIIEPTEEYVTPDDIAESSLLERIL